MAPFILAVLAMVIGFFAGQRVGFDDAHEQLCEVLKMAEKAYNNGMTVV